MVEVLGIEEVKTTPQTPWQNPYVECVIGSIRRACLDHIVPLNEALLRRLLSEYVVYYQESRTNLSLGGNAPERQEEETVGEVISTTVLGGLHHRYSRSAA